MRKMLLVSTVLFVAAQAFAANVTMSVTKKAGTGSDRWASIGYSADANVSAFGLKVYTYSDANNCVRFTAINDYNVGESNSVKKGYGIFPGTIDVCDTNGTVLSWGTPIAPSWDPCAAGTGLDTNTIIVEMGALYEEGNKPPLNGTLISVKVDGECNVCVAGEPLRGNVVVYETNGCVASVSPNIVCAYITPPLVYYDFGDAPDTYLTLLPNGARHTMTGPNTGGPILGVNIDAEADGKPSANCLLDDTTGVPDDEDGITNLTAVYNQGGTVTVTVSAASKLDAWIDWNNNGVWNLPGEQVFASQQLNNVSPAVNNLTFAVPAGATKGVALVSRWRVSTAGGLTPGGLAENGEVEDYRGPTVLCHVPNVVGDLNSVASAKLDANGFTNIVTVKEYNDVVAKDYVLKTTPGWCNTIDCATSVTMTVSLGRQPLDYGDLLDTYRTVWANNGARHVPTGVKLGVNRDAELDGLPTANAKGDDINGVPDDEDGVQFWGGRIARVTVSQACKLSAWVDFDANGSFNDSNERIFNSTALTAGSKSLLFAVPVGAKTDIYLNSRWRVDANGGLSFTGLAPDGEVEDYNKPFISTCYEPCDPCYTDWDTVGRPYCWCYLRQCHGDADGAASTTKAPFFWVTSADLTILKGGWNKTVDLLAGTNICADFDRRASTTKAPFLRVTSADLTILKANWNISGKPDPNCNPGTKTPATAPLME